MAGSIVQCPAPTIDDSGSMTTTIAQTINNVQAGNTIVAFVAAGDSGTIVCTVSDGTSYTQAGSNARDTGNSQGSWAFYLPNAGAGSHTVTATFNSTTPYRRIRLVEVAGVPTTSPLDVATQQWQSAPGTGTDGISSGSTSTTNADDFLLGLTQNTGDVAPGSGTLSAGTNFTITPTADRIMGVEGRKVSSVGSYAATFTQSSAFPATTHLLAFKEVSTGGIVIPVFSHHYRQQGMQ